MTNRRGWLQGENSCRGGTPFRIDSHLFARIKKVTASQDDGFVEGLKTSGWVCEQHEMIEKVTGSQDDDFCGGFGKTHPNLG
jgi:hypothetical protein